MKSYSKPRLTAVLSTFFVLAGGIYFPSAETMPQEQASGSSRIGGYYVSFDEAAEGTPAMLERGILSITDGRIDKIEEYEENLEDVVYLDDACVMFPGLLDLHAHIDYNSIQLWSSKENEVPWDNRFEWRASDGNKTDLSLPHAALAEQWEETGDLIEYFNELQAAAGGTTLIQEHINSDDEYDCSDSHEKLRIIRSTGDAADLGAEAGKQIKSFVQVFKPEEPLVTEDPSTYLPPIDTSSWNVFRDLDSQTGKERLGEVLDFTLDSRVGGYLIHMAEGRAGNLSDQPDAYSKLEFDTFVDAVETGIQNGDFTAEDIKNAHINLIHACTVDLANEAYYRFVRDYGIGLIWSPVSNLILYADTPSYYDYLGDENVLVAIGSDWSPSGSKTVWDECKFAEGLMQELAADKVNIREDLLRACTVTPARMIGNESVGNIKAGGFADLFILRGERDIADSLDNALETFIYTEDAGVEAVVVNGRAVYGEEAFLKTFTGDDGLSSYGRYESGTEVLNSKYFFIPDLFEGNSFEDLYEKYTAVLAGASIEESLLRSQEDDFYCQFVTELEEEFTS